jgi:hypothetical protein
MYWNSDNRFAIINGFHATAVASMGDENFDVGMR